MSECVWRVWPVQLYPCCEIGATIWAKYDGAYDEKFDFAKVRAFRLLSTATEKVLYETPEDFDPRFNEDRLMEMFGPPSNKEDQRVCAMQDHCLLAAWDLYDIRLMRARK